MSQFKLTAVNHEAGNLAKALGISRERTEVFSDRLSEIFVEEQLREGGISKSRVLEQMAEIAQDTNELAMIMFTLGTLLK